MHPYIVEDVVALVVVALLDQLSGLHLLRQRSFVLLLVVLNCATLLADGYLTARPVLLYSDRLLTLPRLWRLPLEDLGYGTALFVLAIETWELLGRAAKPRR